MSVSIYVTDNRGQPIGNASINCGGCAVTNVGDGFYSVDSDLTPATGAFTVSAPGKMPTVYSWWTNLFAGGNVTLTDPVEEPESKW